MIEQKVARASEMVGAMPSEILNKIVSVFVPGSFARGDYNPPHSDFDFGIVRKDDVELYPIAMIRQFDFFQALVPDPGKVLKDYVDIRLSDIPTSPEGVYRLAEYDGERYIWPYLWVYGFDLAAHRIHLYGPDLIAMMPTIDPRILVAHHVRHVDIFRPFEKAAREQRNDFFVPRLTTHLLKQAQLYFGEPTINKFEVLPLFVKHVPEFPTKPFAAELWDEYMHHRIFNYGDPGGTPGIRNFEDKTLEFARELADVLRKSVLG